MFLNYNTHMYIRVVQKMKTGKMKNILHDRLRSVKNVIKNKIC